MDCRRTLIPAVWLLTGALGCATDRGTAVPVRETPPPPLANTSAYNPSKPMAELPKRMPQPATCDQAGNFFAGEAMALDKGSTAQEQMRDKARKAYQQAIATDPTYLPAYQSLGRLYMDMDDYEHAVAIYRKALKMQPRNASVWFDLGMCQARRKEWPAAIESLTKAVEFEPENRQYVNTLGFTLARAGQYQASLKCFSRVTNEAMAHYQLARMLHHMNQDELARQCALIAVQKDPNLEQARTLLGQLGDSSGPAQPIRTVVHTEDALPVTDAPPSTASQPQELPREVIEMEAESPGRGFILPPPPAASSDWKRLVPQE